MRFSTKAQSSGDSCRRQTKKAIEYAALNNLVLDSGTYSDEGVSAFKGKNAETGKLAAFIQAVDDGIIESNSYLLVESLDRLSRNFVDEALELFLGITRRGITIVTLADKPPQVYSREQTKKDGGRSLQESINVMIRSHEESVTKSGRVKEGLAERRAQGKKRERGPHWLRLRSDGMEYEINEDQAEPIRQMFRMCASGSGAHTIAKTINALGGKQWQSPNVLRLLRSPSVIGTLVSSRGLEPLMDHYKPIINKQLFYEVQTILERRAGIGGGRRPEDVPNLFTGLLRCANCSAALRFNRKDGKHSYLKCTNSLQLAKDCDAGSIQYNAFEKEMIAWLLIDQNDELIPLFRQRRPNISDSIRAEISSLSDQRARLYGLVMTGDLLNTSVATQKLNEIELKINALQSQIVLDAPEDDGREAVERAITLAASHEQHSYDDDPTRFREIRRELRTAFQKAISTIRVTEERRENHRIVCDVQVKFAWFDGSIEHSITRGGV